MRIYKNAVSPIDAEELLELERIKPLTSILEALEKSVKCHAFTQEHSRSNPSLKIYEEQKYDIDSEEELGLPLIFPRIYIETVDPSQPTFFIRIDLKNVSCSSIDDSKIRQFEASKFFKYFRVCFYDNFVGFYSAFDAGTQAVAGLLTYYADLLFDSSDNIHMDKCMDITKGDHSLAKIDRDIKVPETFQRALSKLYELGIEEGDNTYLRIMPSDPTREEDTLVIEIIAENGDICFLEQRRIGDEEDLDRLRAYKNFDSIHIYILDQTYYEIMLLPDSEFMMRFITDYFNFLYPDIKEDNIVAGIACVNPHNEDEYVEFRFYPDGTEDSEEKLAEFIEAKRNWQF